VSDNAFVSRRIGVLLGGSGLIIVAVGLAIVATPKLTSSEGGVERQASGPTVATPLTNTQGCTRLRPGPNDLGMDWGVAVGQLTLIPSAGSTWHGIDPAGQRLPGRLFEELEAQLEGVVEVDRQTGAFTLPTFTGEWTRFPVNATTANCLTWMMNPYGALDIVGKTFPGEVVFLAGTATSPIAMNTIAAGARVVEFGSYVGEGVTALRLPMNWRYQDGDGNGTWAGELRLLDVSTNVPKQFILADGQPVSEHSELGKRLIQAGAIPIGGAVLVPDVPAPSGYQWVIATNG
jgi:hypothetical protein